MAHQAYCSGCMATQPIDANWRALWIDSDGDLLMSRPERDGDIDFERPGTVFACGQGAALCIVERYLHSGTFDHAPESINEPLTADESVAERMAAYFFLGDIR
ncbi:hypothetical protein FTO74_14270 [Granulicella sp. WH15]|uniref:hypothetical protein n=1 Tax=Granulicella sp. WH15 TaxID=2602070 RepID=UPI0013671CD3|nr:hypothetical protein [Granulicella sp. WH15]QHN04397.1 hypothetical protein FTO74_14270 [Granulicella sp. WH15]